MNATASRVLVVEDQTFFSQLLNVIVSSFGYEVRTARDGEAALRLLHTFAPDAIMLDIDLPGIDGLEVLRRIRGTHSRTSLPIMMASARGEPSIVSQAAHLGANSFLRKPYSIRDVAERLDTLLRNTSNRDNALHL